MSSTEQAVQSTKLYNMPWIDSNDALGTFMAATPVDVNNLTNGTQTYGFSEGLIYLDNTCYDFWMLLANEIGLGYSLGLVSAVFVTKLVFSPFVLYSVRHYHI